jgi:hypothetical protein
MRLVTIKSKTGRIISSRDITPQEAAYKHIPDFSKKIQLTQAIPRDPQEFYEDFGYFSHDYLRDENKLPIPVKKLTWYQYEFARMNFGVALKSNKVGMTSSELLGDFHTRLLPESAGFDCLVSAPKIEIANELVMKLKKWVANSRKYSKFLIKRPDFEDFGEEKSKIGVLWVRNPYNPQEKSRVIAVGNSLSSVYSRMKVNRIHITDPSLLKIKKQDDYFAGLFSRLANTGGQIKIEGVPLTKIGWFWKICKVLFNLTDTFEDSKSPSEKLVESEDNYEIPSEITNVFDKIKITIEDAVKAGVIPSHVRDRLKMTLPPAKYSQTFMAEFLDPEGSAFAGSFSVGEHTVEEW